MRTIALRFTNILRMQTKDSVPVFTACCSTSKIERPDNHVMPRNNGFEVPLGCRVGKGHIGMTSDEVAVLDVTRMGVKRTRKVLHIVSTYSVR